MTELPESELETFLLTATEAGGLGSASEVFDGYRCLLGAIERAEELGEYGMPWPAELVARYRLALDRYGAGWGLRIE